MELVKHKRVFLIGFMGSGKTSLGKLVANQLDVRFIDLDFYIEQRYHMTISQLFAEYGEDGFRQIEKNMLRETGEFEDVVISTGGGTPCYFDNMSYMKNQGVAIFLQVPEEELANRLMTAKDTRPLIKGKNKEQLMEYITTTLKQRNAYYEQAHLIFDAERMTNRREMATLSNKLINCIATYETI